MANRFRSVRGPAPGEKCIDIHLLDQWLPAPVKNSIGLGIAWGIVRREYCAALVARGVCPIQCERCQVEVVDLFRLEKNMRNPEAVLTWRAKGHSARFIEHLFQEQKDDFPAQETCAANVKSPGRLYDGLFPTRRERSLFDQLREEFGDDDGMEDR